MWHDLLTKWLAEVAIQFLICESGFNLIKRHSWLASGYVPPYPHCFLIYFPSFVANSHCDFTKLDIVIKWYSISFAFGVD